jgi:hypothetical protein
MSPGDVAVTTPVAAAAQKPGTSWAGIAWAMGYRSRITVGALSVDMTPINGTTRLVRSAFAFLSAHGEN